MKIRFLFALLLIFAGASALLLRAAYVQVLENEYYIQEADKRSLRTAKIPSARGDIVDRNGNLLSVSVKAESIVADPKVIYEKDSLSKKEYWQALAKALGVSYESLIKKIEKNPKSRFVWIARQVTPGVAEYVKGLKIDGVSLVGEFRRFYPKGEETAHIVGYTHRDGDGAEGIEKSFDTLLEGKSGKYVYRKDQKGHIVEDVAKVEKYEAHDIALSIDEKLQAMVYREIKKAVAENKATSGTAVLVDIRTGEILAMANAPSYNPNNLSNVKAEARRNRAITDTFEPGSTVKPFVVLTALERGIISPNTVLDTRPFVVNGHTIRDVAPRESLDITGILQKSSNVGVSRLALKMPPNALMETYSKAGIGKATGLGLIGEQQGILPINRTRWADIERATVAYGYGLTVTPLQLARAYVTLGSFGIYRPLSITKVDPPVIGERVYSEKVARQVVKMMESVAQKGGGGIAAAVPDYRVAVKTGTAKKLEKGKYVDKYLAYTAGVAPASDPRFALVVLIDEPKAGKYYGGAISAPVFSKIMGYTLRSQNIKPDNLSDEKTASRIIRLNSTAQKQSDTEYQQ